MPFWSTRIVLPHVRPVLLFVVLLDTIRSFQIFIEVYLDPSHGPSIHTLSTPDVYGLPREGEPLPTSHGEDLYGRIFARNPP